MNTGLQVGTETGLFIIWTWTRALPVHSPEQRMPVNCFHLGRPLNELPPPVRGLLTPQ